MQLARVRSDKTIIGEQYQGVAKITYKVIGSKAVRCYRMISVSARPLANMKWVSRIVLGFCVFILLGSSPGFCDETVPPILSVDLRAFGYVRPTAEREKRVYDFLRYSVAFLDDETLTVSFLKKNDHPGLSRRDGTPGGEYVFHTALLDPLTGRVRGQHTWGNAGNWNALLPLENGNFFVQDDVWIRVYSKELQEIASKKQDVPGDLLPRYSVSPSGRALFEFQDAYDNKRGWLTRISLLDPLTLEQKQSKLTPGHADETVSDAQVVYSLANPRNELLLFVYNAGDSGTARGPRLLEETSATAKLLSKSRCKSAAFINNSVLAVTGDCSFLMLLQSGEEVAELYAPKYQIGGEIRSSRSGRLFAFARSQTKRGSSRIANLELCAYDLAKRKLVFTTSVVPLPLYKLAFALSPDGSLLAMQSDSLLRVWHLQPANSLVPD
jgi:hypothetical protein